MLECSGNRGESRCGPRTFARFGATVLLRGVKKQSGRLLGEDRVGDSSAGAAGNGGVTIGALRLPGGMPDSCGQADVASDAITEPAK